MEEYKRAAATHGNKSDQLFEFAKKRKEKLEEMVRTEEEVRRERE
jgi:hypothetical protein